MNRFTQQRKWSIIFCSLYTIACGSNPDLIQYSTAPAKPLQGVEIIGDDEVSMSGDLLVVGQHLILIDREADRVIKIFDLSGNLVLDFGIIGQGPGEFIGPSQLMAAEGEGEFSVFDGQARRVLKYQLDDILQGILEPIKTTNIEEPSGIPLRMAPVRGDEFAAIGTFSEGRIAYYDQEGKHLRKIGKLPVSDPADFAAQHSHGHSGNLAYNPQRNILCVATRLSSVAEFYDGHGTIVLKYNGPEIFYPEYDIVPVNGTSYHSMTYNKKSRFGFVDVVYHEGSDCWFFLYSGNVRKPRSLAQYGRELICADSHGLLRGRYRLNLPLLYIALAPDGTLFGMGEAAILKFRLDDLPAD